MDARALAARAAEGGSHCAEAGGKIWGFVEASADRILWQGRLFSVLDSDADAPEEDAFLVDADATYEACPAALLLAILARAARTFARGDRVSGDKMLDAFLLWEGLPWTSALAYENLQDPLVRPALLSAMLQLKVLQALALRPEQLCQRFSDAIAWMLSSAAGRSLTVSVNGSDNLHGYGSLAHTAMVIASLGRDMLHDVTACVGARQIAHVFSARRILDLRPGIGAWHLEEVRQLEMRYHHVAAAGGLWVGTVNSLHEGLSEQVAWLSQARRGGSRPELSIPREELPYGPLAIWARDLAPVYSESNKDPVLERILALVGVTNRYFVEVGTQTGEQCNTRHLRVRYGFEGLMLDDNYQNVELNQRRHRVTPDNIVELFRRYEVPSRFDLLSLDTDGNEWNLWLRLHRGSFSPRVVVLEYNAKLPYNQDVLVRYTDFPVHRLCLASLQSLPWLAGGSLTAILALGRAMGYRLVYIVAGGTSDLVFVRADVLKKSKVDFPAQDDPAGLCALVAYQWGAAAGAAVCTRDWGDRRPSSELLTTSAKALAGDLRVPSGWDRDRLQAAFC